MKQVVPELSVYANQIHNTSEKIKSSIIISNNLIAGNTRRLHLELPLTLEDREDIDNALVNYLAIGIDNSTSDEPESL